MCRLLSLNEGSLLSRDTLTPSRKGGIAQVFRNKAAPPPTGGGKGFSGRAAERHYQRAGLSGSDDKPHTGRVDRPQGGSEGSR